MAEPPLRGIPDDKDFIQSLSHAIGFLAVQFGLFEFSLNGTIAIIHQTVGQPISSRGALPYTLKERLRYVRTAARRYSALEPYKDELLDLMALAKVLARTRNGVLHGYPADYDPATHTLTFLSAAPDKPDKSMHRTSMFVASAHDLADHGIRAERLATKMGKLCHRLIDEIVPEGGV
jgi:hypothetical protein